jgi:hypothetical protein
MAIKEQFYDNRPRVLLDPRASHRIDPRFKYTRDSIGTYVDANGIVQTASANEPRFDYDLVTGESLGLLVEESRTNTVVNSQVFTSGFNRSGINPLTQSTTVTTPAGLTDGVGVITESSGGTVHEFYAASSTQVTGKRTYSIFVKPNGRNYCVLSTSSFTHDLVNGTTLGSASGEFLSATTTKISNGWVRCTLTRNHSNTYDQFDFKLAKDGLNDYAYSGDGTSGVYVWGAQLEEGYPTSYISTSGSAVTRAADLLSIEAPLPATGSLYIDARALGANENDTLLSLKNDSNNKIDLAYLSNTATYNSLALIANYDGTSKPSLPLPVPTTDRERNIITYGANNYQYGRDSSRFAPSLSSSVPTNLNKLSIGHDAVDATKAFNGYINTVYAWSGELTPEVAEALVRGEIDAIDADTYLPTGPAGSLALVINTQGAAADGEKTFTLPAKSVATDNDIVITWGDGTESGLSNAAAELGASSLTHEYPSAGIYPVWVEGKMQNIQYNNISNADDLLLIAEWGTGDMLTSPSTMNGAFYGCSQMDFSSSARTTNRPDTSAVTDWANAFRDCSSITGTFPSFDFTAATTFSSTWNGCSSLASMPAIFVADGDVTENVTNFSNAWNQCSSLTSFPLINTSSGTDFSNAWNGCSSLTSFPLINTSSGTDFSNAWNGCSSLTSFPLINTSSGTNFIEAWRGCSSLTSFPLINTSLGTDFRNTWLGCSSLTSFPLIDTSSGTNFGGAWTGCSSLTSFPLIDTSLGTNFGSAWTGCSSLTSFPLIDTSLGTDFRNTWGGCSSLTSFPLIDTSSGTNFSDAWSGCTSLSSFPNIDTSSGTNFSYAWYFCSSLTSFPTLDISNGTTFAFAWYRCVGLTDFPANFFDNWTGTPANRCFYQTWEDCFVLTPAAVVKILNSIAASGQSAPSGTGVGDKEINIDWDNTGDPATDAATAITTLKSRNWDIYLNGVQQ